MKTEAEMGASQPQVQGPRVPWETEEAGGTLLDLPTEPSPAPVSSQTAVWPGAEGGHISAAAAKPAGICYSSPRPSHSRETRGLDRGFLPQRKVLAEAHVGEAPGGHTDPAARASRGPVPGSGPPLLCVVGKAGTLSLQNHGCGGQPGLFPMAAPGSHHVPAQLVPEPGLSCP